MLKSVRGATWTNYVYIGIEGQRTFGIRDFGLIVRLSKNSTQTAARSLSVKNNNNSSINHTKSTKLVIPDNKSRSDRQISSIKDTYKFYGNMSSKHLATGSTCPPVQDGVLRIYSMRFCPYAQRALLVADAKGIPHDVVNANLKDKPEWLFKLNPTAKVPTIETAQGSLYESLIISDYLDEVYAAHPLNSADPFQKALDRIWVENFSRVITLYFKLVKNRTDLDAVKTFTKDLTEELGTFENELERRGTLFFGSAKEPGMLDYMIWPWIERLPIMKLFFPNMSDFEDAKKTYPKLEQWRQIMKEDPAVKASFLAPEIHHQFIKSYLEDNPNYDILD